MTFFPFGIPSTSSFADNVQRARQVRNPTLTIGHAVTASFSRKGTDAPDPTGCPTGYFDATVGYDVGGVVRAPVPTTTNPLVDRTKYFLCVPTPPPTPTPTETPTPTPTETPTPTPTPVEVCDEELISVGNGSCGNNVSQEDILRRSSFNKYYLLADCETPADGTYWEVGNPTPGSYACIDGTCTFTAC